jgi:hypothetical protein
MNNQIAELWATAGDIARVKHRTIFCTAEEQAGAFAGLIIKECIGVCNGGDKTQSSSGAGIMIENYFDLRGNDIDLKIQRKTLIEYMQVMIAKNDWGNVSDAANDLRQLEVSMSKN